MKLKSDEGVWVPQWQKRSAISNFHFMKRFHQSFLGSNWAMLLVAWVVNSADVRAQTTSIQTSPISIVNEAAILQVPARPAGVTNVPLARLEVGGSRSNIYAGSDSLSSFLVEFFGRAERPRMTESETADYTMRATVITRPEMTIVQSKGSKFDPRKWLLFKKFMGNWGDLADVSGLTFDSTNITVAVRCGVEMRLLDKSREIVGVRAIHLMRTNSLRGLGMELSGFRVGNNNAVDVENLLRNLNGAAMQELLVNQAAYHASTNLLVSVMDKRFVQSGSTNTASVKKDPDRKVETSLEPKIPKPDPSSSSDTEWLTPAEAAKILKVTEQEILNSIEKGEIKARKIGVHVRIRKSDLY